MPPADSLVRLSRPMTRPQSRLNAGNGKFTRPKHTFPGQLLQPDSECWRIHIAEITQEALTCVYFLQGFGSQRLTTIREQICNKGLKICNIFVENHALVAYYDTARHRMLPNIRSRTLSERKRLKIGVQEGGGPPPGYSWTALILDDAFHEAKGFLNDAQYEHMALQVKQAASEDAPTHSPVLSIRKIEDEDFFELRDKGGVLNSINVRLFFGIDKPKRSIVVLGVIKKQNNGPTPRGDRIRMRRRWRKYRNGDYG